MKNITLKDFFVLFITASIVYLFIVPIETLNGDSFIGNIFSPAILFLVFSFYFFMFYDFSIKNRVKKLKAIWFVCFFIFNYITAISYYFFFYRNK